jgi:hypothetical protein
MSSPTTTDSSPLSYADAVARFAAAGAAVAELTAAGALSAVPADELPGLISTVHLTADRASAAVHAGVAAVHRSGVAPGGHGSTVGWLQANARVSKDQAIGMLARSTSLTERYAATAAAWLDGRISGAAVQVLTSGIDWALSVLPHDEQPAKAAEAEQILVGIAEEFTVSDVATAVRRLKHVVDPEGAARAALEAHEDQRLRFTPDGYLVRLDGRLTHEVAAMLETALDQMVDGWRREGALAQADQVEGDDVLAQRRRRQRRPHLLALALGHLAATFLENGELGEHHGVRPHITLTVDAGRLAAGLGGELRRADDEPVLLPPASIRRLLCDSSVTPVITASSGTGDSLADLLRPHRDDVLYVGRTHRVVTPRQRRALEVRDQHCAFPGCRVSTRRTEAHHVIPWEDDGPTDLDNLVLLCKAHHHAVHEGGWWLTPTGDDPGRAGCWRFHPPRR